MSPALPSVSDSVLAVPAECLTLDESVTIAKRSLDTSVESSPAGKRRPERHSFGRPTLDVSTDIGRELNVSLDWEERLRELVDQGRWRHSAPSRRDFLAGAGAAI